MTSTILVIEDNEQNLYLMRFLLEASKFRVLEARSGQEGFGMLQSETPDLILLDIQLPCMDGLEVARQLRENGTLVGRAHCRGYFACNGWRPRTYSWGRLRWLHRKAH